MQFNFLVGHFDIIQYKESTKCFLLPVTKEFAENKNKLFSKIRVLKHILWEDPLNDIFLSVYYFLRYEQFY